MNAESSPIRVGVVADTIEGPGGMGRYARELVSALARRDDVELVVAAPAAARDRLAALNAPRPVRMVPLPGRGQVADAVWERLRLGAGFEAVGVEVVHGTKHLLPRTGRPTVLTVHDLTLFSRPAEVAWLKRLLLPSQYRAALRQATALLTDSVATRDRLADFDPRWTVKAEAAPLGATSGLRLVEPQPVPGLDEAPFALVVGDLSPRKNLDLLAGIWDDVHRATGAVLVVAGAGGLRSASLDRRLDDLEYRGLVRRLGRVPGPALRWCYEHCQVLLFPSFEEGFGFPIVEARLFGAPVVASTDPALVEASAGAAVHVDPRDAQGWSDAVVKALSVGREGAAFPAVEGTGPMPTWDDHAASAVRLYRRVLDGPAPDGPS